MSLSRKVTIPSQILARDVGEETVILDLASGTYFGLNPVGARMWQLLGENKNLADVLDIMLAEYEVSREDLERDLLGLLEELASRGLVAMR